MLDHSRNLSTGTAIFTAACPFSHFLVAIPTTGRSATLAATAWFDNVFLKLDFLAALLSERGVEFLNTVLHKVSRLLSIKQVFTSSYCPRANEASLPAQSRGREEQYKRGQLIIYLPKSNNQADEGISLKLAQYLEPLGKAPVSEACKHLYSVYPAAKRILAKLRRMRGLTEHCRYLSLKGDPSGGAYYLVLDQAAYRQPHTDQGILVGEIVEAGEVKVTVVVHTYCPTGRRTRLAKARV